MELTKRALAVLLALVLLCVCVPFAAAEDVTIVDSGVCGNVYPNYDNLTWTLDSEGTLTISGTGAMRNYSTTNDNGTTRTSAPWGKYFRTIKAVVIGDGVTSIGNNAFYRCTALKSVTLGDSLQNIGDSAFSGCAALESVTFGDSLQSIGTYAFSNCTALESVTFGDGLQSIGNYAFGYCYALESVTFGSHSLSVGTEPFYDCIKLMNICLTDLSAWLSSSGLNYIMSYGASSKNLYLNGELLTDLVIPEGATSIPAYAFYRCTALESVTLPDGVTSIGDYAFGNSSWYTLVRCNRDTDTAAAVAASGSIYTFLDATDEESIISETVNAKLSYTIDKRTRTLTVTNDGAMVSFASFTAPWVEYQKYITDVVIEPGCTSVSYSAFLNCYNIKRVTLPDGIEKIDGSAFDQCTRLAAINLPDGVETIGDAAFGGCSSLPSIALPDSVTSIGSNAFYHCTALESVTFGDSLQSIGNEAFYYCTALENVTFGDGLQSIGNDAFYNCTAMESVTFGAGLRSIGSYAFYHCTALESVTFGDSLQSIDRCAFYNCTALESIVIPDSVSSIGDYAFQGCRALKTVVIGDGVMSIPSYAFSGCSALETVSIGDSVQRIYEGAFSGCTSLATVVLPASGTSLSSRAFPEKALKDIYIYNDNCSIATDAIYYSATIHAYQGSTAETFADTYGYSFVPITDVPPHEHDKTLVPGYAATCTAAGLTDGYKCSVCGVWFQKQKEIKALGHNYQAVETVPATETETGYIRYECSRCDAGYTETLPVLTHEHSYSETERVNATCLEDGYVTYTCAGCGHSYTDLLPASGHSFGAWKTFLPTEAGQKGIDVRFCDVCGVYELRESESVSGGSVTPTDPGYVHNFVLVESKAADCLLAGYNRYICTCGQGKAETYDALGHDWQNETIYPPTCENAGYTQCICARCGAAQVTDVTTALGHDYEEKITPATCTLKGEIADVCNNCGDRIVKGWIEQLGHIDADGNYYCDRCGDIMPSHIHLWGKMILMEGSCEKGGQATHSCTACGTVESVTILPGRHPQDALKTIKGYAASCTEKGKTDQIVCELCGVVLQQAVETNALGHNWSDWSIIVEPKSCNEPGERQRSCTRCGKTENEVLSIEHLPETSKKIEPTCSLAGQKEGLKCRVCGTIISGCETIPAIGHDYRSQVMAPTCTESGKTVYTCSRCYDTYEDKPTAALGHTDANDDGVCDRCSTILNPTQPDQPQDEEPQGFFAKIGAFFRNLFDRIFGIFRR